MYEGQKINDRIKLIPKILRYTFIAKFYWNGDVVSLVWRWWNPLSWPLAVIFFLIYGFIEGYPFAWKNREDIGWRIDPFLKNDLKEKGEKLNVK